MANLYIPSTQVLRMLSHSSRAIRPVPLCQQCQHRALSTTSYRSKKQFLTPEYNHNRRRDGELQPKPLSRPLGLPYPPKPGQNTGRDTRTLRQRRDDFASYEKYKVRQQEIVADIFDRHYYRDIGNLGKIHKGKSILAPATPFKSGVALYFPNLEGMTLEGAGVGWGKKWGQTTEVLRGKVSLVEMVHTTWADEQVQSYVGKEENPALAEVLDGYEPARGVLQQVTVNTEENPLKAFMVRMFFGRVRREVGKGRWGTWFLNRRGLTEDIRDALAMWNSKVGYLYLVDGQCRVRWAANGYARPEEKESLVRCVRRLVDEARGVQRGVRREEPRAPRTFEVKKEATQAEQKQAIAAG